MKSLALRAALAPALLALFAGCGPGEAEPDFSVTGHVLRLKPALSTSLPEATLERVVRYEVTGEELPENWTITTGTEEARVHHEVLSRFAGPWYGLQAPGSDALSVRIDGELDPATFNRAAITFAVNGKCEIALGLHQGGRMVLSTPFVRYEGEGSPTTVIVELPRTILHVQPFAALSVRIRELDRTTSLLGVDLLRTPITALVPEAGDAFVNAGESRCSFGLPTGNPATASFRGMEGTLAFSVTRPLGFSAPRRRLEVLTRLVVDGATLAEERSPVRFNRKRSEWLDVRVPVPPEAVGEEVTVTFELLCSPHGEAVVVLGSPRVEVRGTDPKTVILVTSDTHRADHLGISGDPGVAVETPFLDSLARRGVYFGDCYASTNITNPSHGALMTALPIRDTGVINNITELSSSARTLAEQFQSSGYLTLASVSAGHMRHDQSGLGQGFDRLDHPARGDRDSVETIARLIGALEGTEGLPLFLWLHVFDAHAPYAAPEEYRWRYYDEGKDPRDPSLPELPPSARAKWDPEIRDVDYFRSQYRSEVSYLDDRLAGFLTRPRFEDALIAVTSDHGECFGEQGFFYSHRALIPATLDVPLILTWPEAPAGTRVEAPVDQLDLGRTILDIAGLGALEFPGRNLLGDIEGSESGARFAISSHGTEASIERGGWFLILRLGTTGQGRRHEVELYHLAADPECATNLLDEEFERARALREELIAWLDAAPSVKLSKTSGALDAQTIAELAELGYADDSGADTAGDWYEPDPEDPWCQRFAD